MAERGQLVERDQRLDRLGGRLGEVRARIEHDVLAGHTLLGGARDGVGQECADVGDDVFGDDPTVQRLEARVAEVLGKQAGMFVPSGTQSNLSALMSHCERGDEYIAGQDAHCYSHEAGGAAVLGSIQPQPIAHQPDGTLALDDIAAAIKPDDLHYARTRLLAAAGER